MSLHRPYELVLSYTRFMATTLLLQEDFSRICILGLGAGSLLRFFHHFHPHCLIDAVDSNAHVIELAKGYFQIRESSHVRIHASRGEHFINRAKKGLYDQIYIDTFDDLGMARPVYTREIFTAIREALTEGGTASFNLWSADKGYFDVVKKDLDGVFANVLFLPVPDRGNYVAIATKGRIPWEWLNQRRRDLPHLKKKYLIDFNEIIRIARQNNMPLPTRLAQLFR